MSGFIDEQYFNKIKNLVGKEKLTKQRIDYINKQTGASETTLRRIRKSESFADYQRICREDSKRGHAQRKSTGASMSNEDILHENTHLKKRLKACEDALVESVIDHMSCDVEHGRELTEVREAHSLRGILWFTLGFMIGSVATFVVVTIISGGLI